jgi:AcrR family transcriptional regulator
MLGRDRIVRAAAELVAERGAGGTTLEDVGAATGASETQLHRYFGDDRGLVEAVVDHQCASVLGWQARVLASVNDWRGLQHWAEVIVAEHGFRGGCPIGTLAAELSDTDEELRANLSDAFIAWSDAIHGALLRLRGNGLIAADADLDALTTITLSAIQGGLLLSKTSRDPEQLRTALRGAIAELRAQAPGGGQVGTETQLS